MIPSSRWLVMLATCVAAACCLGSDLAAGLRRSENAVEAEQRPARCRTDCTIEKQSLATLPGVEALVRNAKPRTSQAAVVSGRIVRDSRGRIASISGDFRELLIFDSAGTLLDSPRPKFERLVSLLVDAAGTVQGYDSHARSLLTFDANYQVQAKRSLPHSPTLLLGGGAFLLARQISEPAFLGHPLHVMSPDGNIVRSFGAEAGPFRSANILKNARIVSLNPDGTVWSMAPGGRVLERWDTATSRRLAQVTVKSSWFRESAQVAPLNQVANPIVRTIWPEEDLIWILYETPDPRWIPGPRPETELVSNGYNSDLRSDWVLEAVQIDTGHVVAMKRFDRTLLRRDGSFAIASEIASADRVRGVELWRPMLVKKSKTP